MADLDATVSATVEARGYRRGTLATDSWDQYVVLAKDRIVSFSGRADTFTTPGRGAVGQKLMALHNAAGSAVLVEVHRIRVDALTTLTKVLTVLPPIIRVHRFTTVPTDGTVLAKVPLDTAMTSNASVTAWGDASADTTASAVTLAITPGAIIGQTFGPRMVSAASGNPGAEYEEMDTTTFLEDESCVTLRAGEGIVVFLDQATAASGNPGGATPDLWAATIDWEEYTRP